MKLLCWNINSLVPTVRNAVLKYGSWLGFFQAHGINIMCLQESKVPEDKLTKELCCVGGYQSFWAISREKKGYSGVTTYACEAYAPLSCEADCLGSGEDDIDREGRVVATDHGAFVLIGVYVPNAGDRPDRPRLAYKLRFLAALKRKCDELAAAGRELLVVGDFNVPAEVRDVHPDLIPAGGFAELYSPDEQAALHALTASYPDVWRRLHPDASSTYTVWNERTSARAFNQGLRIDYILCTQGLLDQVVSCEVLSAEVLLPKWSDHAGIMLELRDVAPPPPHRPCMEWQRLHRRFVDTSQKSILGMFQKKRLAAAPAAAVAAAASSAAPGSGGGTAQDEQQPKRQRVDVREAADSNAGVQPAITGGNAINQGPGGQEEGSAGGQHAQQHSVFSKGGAATKQQQQKAAKDAGGAGQQTIGTFFSKGGGGGR